MNMIQTMALQSSVFMNALFRIIVLVRGVTGDGRSDKFKKLGSFGPPLPIRSFIQLGIRRRLKALG